MYSEPSSSSSLAAPVAFPSYPNLLPNACVRYEVAVTDPERKGGNAMQQYICYKVSSSLEYAEGSGESATQSCVIRRFSDFVWLHDRLEADCKGLLIPPLPDKGIMGRFDPDFVEERRRALQLFLERLMEHSVLKRHQLVHLFLTGTDSALQAHKSGGGDASAASFASATLKAQTAKVGASFLSFFSSATQLVSQTLAPGREHAKSAEDVACEQLQEYALAMQKELAQLEGQVEAWLRCEKGLSHAWNDLGASVSAVAVAEGTGRAKDLDDRSDSAAAAIGATTDYVPPVAPAADVASYTSFSAPSLGLGGDSSLAQLLQLLGTSSDSVASMLLRKEADESMEFREPIKDAQRMAAAVESMLKHRSACLSEYHSLLDTLDTARSRLVSAQGTPGREGKLPALESAVAQAEQAADAKRFELAQLSVQVRHEFERSQREKAAAMAQIVRTFVRRQLEHSRKVTHIWQNCLAQVGEEESAHAASS